MQWEKLQKIRSKFEANVNGILYVYNNVLMSIIWIQILLSFLIGQILAADVISVQ